MTARRYETILQDEAAMTELDSLVHDCHVSGRGTWDSDARIYVLEFHRIGFELPQKKRHLFGLFGSTFYPCIPAKLIFSGVLACRHNLRREDEFDQLGGARMSAPGEMTIYRLCGETVLELAPDASLAIEDAGAPLAEGHRFMFS